MNNQTLNRLKNTLFVVGSLLLLIGVGMAVFVDRTPFSGWILLFGGIAYTFSFLLRAPEQGNDAPRPEANKRIRLREKRWRTIAIIAGFFWIFAAVMLIVGQSSWSVWAVVGTVFYINGNLCLTFLKR